MGAINNMSTPKEEVGGAVAALKPAPDVKKLLQQFTDLCSQSQVSLSKCKVVEELFGSELLAKRAHLRELTERLLGMIGKSHGAMVRDRFWRTGLYDVLNRAKMLKKGDWSPLQLAYLQSHLLGGVGHLNFILCRIGGVKNHLPFLANSMHGVFEIESPAGKKEGQEELEKWQKDLIYACLINIGDLYRYLTDILETSGDPQDSQMYFYRAQDMYIQAFHMNTENGMAHNQLGNLSFKLNGGIDSTYYLLYSMNCEKAYEGALPNLRALLDKKLIEFARRPATKQLALVEQFSSSFLSLLQNLLFVETRVNHFDKLFTGALESFDLLLSTPDSDLDPSFYFHVSSAAVLTIWRLQAWQSNNTSSALALAFSLFFNLLSKIGSIISQHSTTQIIEIPEEEPLPQLPTQSNASELSSDTNGGILGFRRRLPNGSRDSEDSDSIISLEGSDDEEEDEGGCPDLRKPPGQAFESSSTSSGSHRGEREDNSEGGGTHEILVMSPEDLEKCRSSLEVTLVGIIPLLKLLEGSDCFKAAFAANCEKIVMGKLADTLNSILNLNWIKVLAGINGKVEEDWMKLKKEPGNGLLKFELPEDGDLKGLVPIKTTFEGLQRIELNSNDCMLVRIGRLLIFGHWLTESASLVYSEEDGKFYVPSAREVERVLRAAKMRQLNDSGVNSNQTVEKLTQLYKAMAMEEKRGEKSRGGRRRGGGDGRRRNRIARPRDPRPVFCVVDLPAVLNFFENVKDLANHFKFIVVCPFFVWVTLDKLKDTDEEGSTEARTAFRWFESSFRAVHRGLRSQKEHERVPVDLTYPKTKDIKGREYFGMMECCNFFLKHSETGSGRDNFFGDIRDRYRVFYLTGQEELMTADETREFSPVGVAKTVGVFLDHICAYPPKGGKSRGRRGVQKSNGVG